MGGGLSYKVKDLKLVRALGEDLDVYQDLGHRVLRAVKRLASKEEQDLLAAKVKSRMASCQQLALTYGLSLQLLQGKPAVVVYYEWDSVTVADEIQRRKASKAYFPEEEVWRIVEAIVAFVRTPLSLEPLPNISSRTFLLKKLKVVDSWMMSSHPYFKCETPPSFQILKTLLQIMSLKALSSVNRAVFQSVVSEITHHYSDALLSFVRALAQGRIQSIPKIIRAKPKIESCERPQIYQPRQQLRNQLRLQPRQQLRNQLRLQPRQQLRNQLRLQPRQQLRNQLRLQPRQQLRNQLRLQPRQQLRNQLRLQPKKQFRQQLRQQIRQQLRQQPKSLLWAQQNMLPRVQHRPQPRIDWRVQPQVQHRNQQKNQCRAQFKAQHSPQPRVQLRLQPKYEQRFHQKQPSQFKLQAMQKYVQHSQYKSQEHRAIQQLKYVKEPCLIRKNIPLKNLGQTAATNFYVQHKSQPKETRLTETQREGYWAKSSSFQKPPQKDQRKRNAYLQAEAQVKSEPKFIAQKRNRQLDRTEDSQDSIDIKFKHEAIRSERSLQQGYNRHSYDRQLPLRVIQQPDNFRNQVDKTKKIAMHQNARVYLSGEGGAAQGYQSKKVGSFLTLDRSDREARQKAMHNQVSKQAKPEQIRKPAERLTGLGARKENRQLNEQSEGGKLFRNARGEGRAEREGGKFQRVRSESQLPNGMRLYAKNLLGAKSPQAKD